MEANVPSWQASIQAFLRPQVVTMLFLGFAAGLPLLLIFSSLSLWLREADVERATVTFFSWAALGYSFKFTWAPLVDRLPIPLLTRALGQRRGWMLLAQVGVIGSICAMAMIDPARSEQALWWLAAAAVCLGFSSATQDIVVDAFRIESADDDLQAMMSATYIAGYRVGMIVAGAGALFLASYFGSQTDAYDYMAWRYAYLIMAACMLIGVVTTLVVSEPAVSSARDLSTSVSDNVRFVLVFLLSALAFVTTFYFAGQMLSQQSGPVFTFIGEAMRLLFAFAMALGVAMVLAKLGLVRQQMIETTYIEPVRDFFARFGFRTALLLLALVGFYRISDIVLGVIANVFYQDMAFTKVEIASVVKTFGLFMTIAGGFIGGILSVRYGVMRVLFLGAVLTVVTNLTFILLALGGKSLPLLYLVISTDNLTAGLASAAFIAFLSSLTNVKFTAVQYAIFSSLMTLLPKLIGGYSGSMVDGVGYVNFFLIAAAMGLPVLWLVWLASKHLRAETT